MSSQSSRLKNLQRARRLLIRRESEAIKKKGTLESEVAARRALGEGLTDENSEKWDRANKLKSELDGFRESIADIDAGIRDLENYRRQVLIAIFSLPRPVESQTAEDLWSMANAVIDSEPREEFE